MRLADQIAISARSMGIDNEFTTSVSRAEKIIADNVFDYVDANRRSIPPGHELPCCKPPFRMTWIEWKSSREAGYERGAILFDHETMHVNGPSQGVSTEMIGEFMRLGSPEANLGATAWSFLVVIKPWNRDDIEAQIHVSGWVKFLDSSGQITGVAVEPWADRNKKTLVAEALMVAANTLAFLHCKNVTVERDQVPLRLARAQEKRRGVKPFTYKTLRIIPIEQFRRGITTRPGNAEDVALHIVRGHFKDYRERGLFGKHKGIFWWDQALAGTADRYVDKLYDVSPADDRT